jgi:large subunit ribosomal protein L13
MQHVQKTFSIKESEINKKWYVVDAEGKRLGRMATEIARILRGKNKPEFTPHMDMGDFVIVVNAEKIELTGNKAWDKEYFRHTEHPGGKRFTNIRQYFRKKPEFIVEHAIKGMLPKNRLGRKIMKKLKIYSGPDHPHAAQKPEKIEL